MSIKKKTQIIIKELTEKLIEREDVVPFIILALYSRSNILLLGPPGVGKTYMIEKIPHFAKELKYFETLIVGNTTLEELFGTKIQTDNGGYEYNIEHSMLDSHICFIDELYKAPSSLLNSLLGVTHNSRSYYQRGRGKLTSPMIFMVAASNELPDNNIADAFDDRIPFRFWIDEIRDTENFKRFVKRDFVQHNNFTEQLTLEELNEVTSKKGDIFIHENIVNMYTIIRTKLWTEKVKISDRKLQTSLDIFQVSALVNERNHVDLSELFLLLDIAWKAFDDITRVKRVIFDTLFGNISEVQKILSANQDSYSILISQMRSHVGNLLQHSYNFNGLKAEIEFLGMRDRILHLLEQANIIFENIESLKNNYFFALELEENIKKNIFLPNYKNHIYLNETSKGTKRVNKNEIFDLSDNVILIQKRLNNWLNHNTGLYEYNVIQQQSR